MLEYYYYTGLYLQSNGIIVIVVLCDLNLNFQGQTFTSYAFSTKNCVGSGCHRQIFLDLHGTRCGVALVVFAIEFWHCRFYIT